MQCLSRLRTVRRPAQGLLRRGLATPSGGAAEPVKRRARWPWLVFLVVAPLPPAYVLYDTNYEFREWLEQRFPGFRALVAPLSGSARKELSVDNTGVKPADEGLLDGKQVDASVRSSAASPAASAEPRGGSPDGKDATGVLLNDRAHETARGATSAERSESSSAATGVLKKNRVDDTAGDDVSAVGDGISVLQSYLNFISDKLRDVRARVFGSGDDHASTPVDDELDFLSDPSALRLAEVETALAIVQESVQNLRVELSERAKWEAVRLEELLRATEIEERKRMGSAMAERRAEFKAKLAAELEKERHELENDIETEIGNRVTAEEAELADALNEDMERRLYAHTEQLEAEWRRQAQLLVDQDTQMREDKAAERLGTLDALQRQMAVLVNVGGDFKQFERTSLFGAEQTSASLALLAGTAGSASTGQAAEAGSGDGGAPETPVERGETPAPSVAALQLQFRRVSRSAQTAAMIPEERQVSALAWLLASIASRLKVRDVPDDETAAPDAILSRAEGKVVEGRLEDAVAELEKLQGMPRQLCDEWIESARSRMQAEQALESAISKARSANAHVA